MFKTRTTKPKNNKYYIRKASGGWNGAIKGNPTDSNANVLSNCFAGETKYITSEGLKTFYDTVGTVQEVLNENGEFVPAEIKSFGEQQLYKVTFNNGYVVYATENHRWVVDSISKYEGKTYTKRKIKTTLELKDTDNIPYNYYNGNGLLDKEGIVHGMVFGDGYKNKHCSTYKLELFGNKTELKKYLPEHIRSDYNLKEVPSIYESEEYLRGFLAGLIATDGTITKDTFKISSINLEALEQIKNICYKIGVHIGSICSETRDVFLGNYEYKNHTIYHLTFKRKGIEKLLLKSSDLEKINYEFKDVKYTRVKSIELTDRYEEVYCAVEPITHTITLENNILTGQCVGYANGRFAEIIGKDKIEYQLACNAENFIERAKKLGLTVVQYPTLGGIMVFQKGATLKGDDGAGHVFINEKLIDKNTIYTSESSWGGVPFYNATRKNDNGRWGMSSKYKFLGCIINPAVGDVHYVEPPKPKKVDIQYQVYDNKKKKWLGVITNYNNTNSNGYAGITGNPIGGIRAKASDGSIVTIKSHIRGGKWLSAIQKWDDTPNGYSGIKGRSIDMFMVKCEGHTVHYRAHIKGGSWLSWITMYNQNNPKGYAGMMGREIDKIQMYID